MRIIILGVLFCSCQFVSAQPDDRPTDFLSKDFHEGRRQKLRSTLPPNSVALFFSSPTRNRSNDVDFEFHQDADFYYLTGYKEPNSLLLLFKEKQTTPKGASYDEIIFVQPRNALTEMWTGRRLGDQGVKEQLGLALSYTNSEFKSYNLDFSKFDDVLFFDFKNDVRDAPSDSSDLYDLIQQFKTKVHYPSKESLSLAPEPQKNNLNTHDLGPTMAQLRSIKTPDELKLLRKAVLVSCQAQIEVMKAMKPGMSEMEVQGIHEYVYKKYQAEDVGYPSIVGAGNNGCILHYDENYKPSVSNRDLILMDVGAEYHGYTADISRTIPASGQFSPEQKQIYELVLLAQEAGMNICKPGTTFQDLNKITHAVVNKGLAALGILKDENEKNSYYPHGCSHPIGLDVHDRKADDVLRENMTITIEPGIYIPENSSCNKKWWGIAVRIEDDFLITKDGYELLSKLGPRTVKEIEETMKLPSPLDNLVLPDLDKKY
jgi:Xaa-Pro aminopeptidase